MHRYTQRYSLLTLPITEPAFLTPTSILKCSCPGPLLSAAGWRRSCPSKSTHDNVDIDTLCKRKTERTHESSQGNAAPAAAHIVEWTLAQRRWLVPGVPLASTPVKSPVPVWSSAPGVFSATPVHDGSPQFVGCPVICPAPLSMQRLLRVVQHYINSYTGLSWDSMCAAVAPQRMFCPTVLFDRRRVQILSHLRKNRPAHPLLYRFVLYNACTHQILQHSSGGLEDGGEGQLEQPTPS